MLFELLLAVALIQPSWLPDKYIRDAEAYFQQADSAQWDDIRWHADRFPGIWGELNAVRASTDGSNRPRGRHGDEDSHQDVGINIDTAALYFPTLSKATLRAMVSEHDFAADLSNRIDMDNFDRQIKKRGRVRPWFNILSEYKWGRKWREGSVIGMVTYARLIVLHKLLNNSP